MTRHKGPWTLRQVLDLAEKPSKNGDTGAVEAVLLLAGGAGRSTHRFVFLERSPVRGKRKFDHFMNICDAWETVTEKRLVELYGDKAVWWDIEKEE